MSSRCHKILVFTEDFPPDVGGIAQWAFGLSQAWHELGHAVGVMTRWRPRYRPDDLPETPYPTFWMRGPRWQQLRTWHCYRHLRRYLRAGNRPEWVLATTWNFARGIRGLSRRYGFRLITAVHGLDVTRKMSRAKQRWLRRTLEDSACVVAVSRFTRQQVIDRYGIPAEKVIAMPPGVDVQRFRPGLDAASLKQKFGIGDRKVILTLARIVERKGHDLVVRALPEVRRQMPDVLYLIAGPADRDYLPRLKRLIQESGVEDAVRFLGYVPAGDLPLLYNLADVYAMPSRELREAGDTEGFGITYLEANACGTPVIGGRSGGVGDAIADGETGFLVDPENPRELAEKLVALLSNRNLREKLGRQGRRRVEQNFTWKRIAERLLAQLEENCSLRKPPDESGNGN